MAYRISTTKAGGGRVHHLHDEADGASASILPAYGFNLFDLRLPVAGKVRPVLSAYDDWADMPRDAGRNGTPVLFPFPNRIRAGKYTFGGKAYALPTNLGPNAIHGFAIDVPWDVVEHKADEKQAWITGRYQISMNSPDKVDQWPTDAALRITYKLSGGVLTLEAVVSNPTDRPLPYGFGIHPYFRMPFDPGADQKKTVVALPASKFWVLEEFLPTGEIRAVDERLDFRKGQPMAGLKLDDVLTGLPGGDDQMCRLIDRNLNAEFRLGFDRNFRELVVYTPPGPGGVISLEPYTQTTDAINLQPRGVDAGLRVLKHGESHTVRITMTTKS